MPAALLLAVSAGQAAPPAGPARTTVSDVVYRADGSLAAGTLLISWPAFTTADHAAVAAGSLSVPIGPGGAVSVALVPNEGAEPAGTYYKVVLKLNGGDTSTEYWTVPAASPASLSAIRATVMPAGVAVQAASRAYVDIAVAGRASDSAVLHNSGDESVAGVKQFSASPLVPTPLADQGAANKAYVDGATSGLGDLYLRKAGDTLAGPLTLSGDPAAPGQAANRHYVDTQIAVVSGALAGKADLGHTQDASTITGGTLDAARLPAVPVAKGGTGQAAWTADRCVRVKSDGSGLEAAAADCNSGIADWANPGAIGSATPSTGIFTTLTAKSGNGVRYASQFAGADVGARVQAAVADLPAGGGNVQVDVAGGAISTDIFTGIAKPVTIVWGAGAYTLSVPIKVPAGVSMQFSPGATFTFSTAGVSLASITGGTYATAVTSSPHGLSSGWYVYISGTTNWNGIFGPITVTNGTTFTFPTPTAFGYTENGVGTVSYAALFQGRIQAGPRQAIFSGANGSFAPWGNAESYVGWYGAAGDGVSDDCTPIQKALDSNWGRTTVIPRTVGKPMFGGQGATSANYDYYTSCTLHQRGNGSTLRGGSPVNWVLGPTTIHVAAGVTGVQMDGNCYGCTLADFLLVGSEPFDRSDARTGILTGTSDGFYILGGEPNLENLGAYNFGRHGFHIDGSQGAPAQPDNWKLYGSIAYGNRGDGLYIHGADSNQGVSYGFNGFANQLYGIKDVSVLGNTHIGPHTNGNHGDASSNPATAAISSISRAGSTVTVVTSTNSTVTALNQYAVIAGVTDATNFPDGTYLVSGYTDLQHFTLTWAGAAVSSSGGTARLANLTEAWTAAGAVGGPYGGGNGNLWLKPYAEINQSPDGFTVQDLVIGGNVPVSWPHSLMSYLGINQVRTSGGSFTFNNPIDSGMTLGIQAGNTANQATALNFFDRLGASRALITMDALGNFTWSVGGAQFLQRATGTNGTLYLDAPGSAYLLLNRNSGSGGVQIAKGDGTATGAATITGAGDIYFKGWSLAGNSGKLTGAFTGARVFTYPDFSGTVQVAALETVTFSSTPTFDCAKGVTHKITLTGNVTSSTLSNCAAGQPVIMLICQDSNGSRTFTWPATMKGGVTIGSTANKCSAQSFVSDGSNAYATGSGVTNQ